MGAWNLQRLQFNNPATMRSFALASFADQRRAGRGREDPGSLEVGSNVVLGCSLGGNSHAVVPHHSSDSLL